MNRLDSHITSSITQRLQMLDELRNSIIKIMSINTQDIKIWPILSNGKLTLFSDDPMLATQVRYQQKNICKQLNSVHNLKLDGVHTKLIPPKKARQPVKSQALPLSKITSKTLSSIANEIEDEELKQILMNISNN